MEADDSLLIRDRTVLLLLECEQEESAADTGQTQKLLQNNHQSSDSNRTRTNRCEGWEPIRDSLLESQPRTPKWERPLSAPLPAMLSPVRDHTHHHKHASQQPPQRIDKQKEESPRQHQQIPAVIRYSGTSPFVRTKQTKSCHVSPRASRRPVCFSLVN